MSRAYDLTLKWTQTAQLGEAHPQSLGSTHPSAFLLRKIRLSLSRTLVLLGGRGGRRVHQMTHLIYKCPWEAPRHGGGNSSFPKPSYGFPTPICSAFHLILISRPIRPKRAARAPPLLLCTSLLQGSGPSRWPQAPCFQLPKRRGWTRWRQRPGAAATESPLA